MEFQESERVVSREEGAALAKELGSLFLECSAKTRANVEQCFEELTLKVIILLHSFRRSQKRCCHGPNTLFHTLKGKMVYQPRDINREKIEKEKEKGFHKLELLLLTYKSAEFAPHKFGRICK